MRWPPRKLPAPCYRASWRSCRSASLALNVPGQHRAAAYMHHLDCATRCQAAGEATILSQLAIVAHLQAELVALEQQPRQGMQLALPLPAAAVVTPASEGGSCSTPADEFHSRVSAPHVPSLNVGTARQVIQQKPQLRASRCLGL